MGRDNRWWEPPDELQERAETILESETDRVSDISPEEAQELIRQLWTSQIELEMQNKRLRLAQADLIETHNKYSDLYNFAPVGYLTISEKGLILEANLTVAELLGIQRAGLIEQRLSAFIIDEDLDAYYKYHGTLLETMVKQFCEVRMRKQVGDPFWASIEGIVVEDAEGDRLRIWLAISCITQRRRMEEALRESEERFRTVVEQAGDALFLVQPDGKFVDVNQCACDALGYTREELLALSVPEIDPFYPTHKFTEFVRRLTDRTAVTVQAIHRRKDGTTFPVEIRAGLIEIQRKPHLLSLVRDVSERKQAHLMLEISNRHMEMGPLLDEFVAAVKSFTGCTAVGIRVLGEDGSIPYQAYDGFPRRFYEMENPLSIETDRCMCIKVVKGETDAKLPFHTEAGSFWVNGTTQSLAAISKEENRETRNTCFRFGYQSMALIPIRLGDRILGLIHVADPRENGICRDIVESLERTAMELGTAIQRVRAEEELRAVNETLETRVGQRTTELEKANRELQGEITERARLEKEVLDIGSNEQRRIGQELHDGLGQELTGLGYLATSLYRKLRTEGSKEAEAAAELAQGIRLALGQVQGIVKGLVPLVIGSEDLVPALRLLTARMEEQTGIACSFQSDCPVSIRDENIAIQLYRIVQEAVTNAVKHAQAEHIDVAIRADRSRITIEVGDDGVGMPPDSERALGSGMHIMRYRARAIGGKLDIKPGTGNGTLVICSLPLEPPDDLQ